MATADFSPSLAPGAALQNRLAGLARRRNAQKMSRALVRAAIPGIGMAAISVLLYKLHIIADGPFWAPIAIVGVSLLVGWRNGYLQRAGNFTAACDADNTLQLNDRLSSALAFVAPAQVQRKTRIAPKDTRFSRVQNTFFPRFALSSAPSASSTDLVPALVEEAAARAQTLDPRRVYPLPFDRASQILVLLSILLVGFCLMPDYAIFQTKEEKQQVAAMQNAGEKLVVIAKSVQKTAPPKAEEVRALSQRLEKLGQKMVRGRLTKRAALTEMGELRQKLEKAQKQGSNSQSGEGKPQIAEALRDAPLQSQTGQKVQEQLKQNDPDQAAKELEKLAEKLENGEISEDEKKKAADDLEKTARDLRSRGGQANQNAAQKLEEAAKQLREPKQNGQQNPGQQGQKPQSNGQQQNPAQPGQNPQGQQKQGQQKQGQQNSQSSQPKGQNPNGQNQNGQPKQGPQNGQKQAGQSQNGGNQQQQQPQGGQQGSQGGAGQQSPGGQQGNQGAADALRDMANGLRNGGASGGNSQNLRDMMSKLREAENQTGSNGGQQSGQGKMGQGNGSGPQPGQGQMKDVTPGQDLMPTDPHGTVGGGAGLGPRNNAQGSTPGGVSKLKSKRTGDKRRYGDVWSDRLPKTHKKIDRINGKWGGNGEVEQMPTKGESKGGEVKTPYYEVYESYKHDAEEAVGRESVPPAYKQPVKDYFESIKP